MKSHVFSIAILVNQFKAYLFIYLNPYLKLI